jgi:segregation and condensation protein B
MEIKNDEWLKSCIESIIFIAECPVKPASIASCLKIPEKKAAELIDALEKEYIDKNRGFVLRKTGGGYRFYSNPRFHEQVREFVKSNISTYLSQAALETLAIALYRQPVTRTQVAEIRGVRTDSVFQTLIDKGLIRESGRLKEPGNPKVYKVTERLYEILGINANSDLPPLKDFEEESI